MKKSLKIICVTILLAALIVPVAYSKTIANTDSNKITDAKTFFEISKLEISKKDKIEMILDVDSVKFNEFVFELKSDETMQNIEILQDDKVENEKSNHEIIIEINKEKTNIKNINFYYSIPDNKKVGDTIKFTATATSIVKDVEKIDVSQNGTSIEADDELTDGSVKDEVEKQSVEFEIKIIDDKKDDKDNIQEPNKEDFQKPNISNIQYGGVNNMSFSSNQVIKAVTYNGSDNNYLSELFVEGYNLNKEYSKENTTYFMTVENEIDKLNITTSVEDSGATVCIYGNENLKEGINKILISVTAENGNVRNYRIYVTKKV